MSNRDHSTFGLDRRAVSEVVGYTLLIGITTVTVVALLIAATSLHGALQGSAETESVQQEMQDVDASFGRIAHGDNRTSVSVRTETANRLSVVRDGDVRLLINENTSCMLSESLSSIRHEKDQETLAYELGGTIRVTGGGQAMISSPNLRFENGTLDLTITNITGRTASSMTLVKNVESSMGPEETDKILFAESCSQPKNVTVSITSDFADAWERYAEEEFPAGTVNRSGNTVNVTLNRTHLPEAVDPSRNMVVTFTNSSQYDLNDSVPNITINKSDDSNVYPVRMVPLYQGVQITRTDETEIDTDAFRRGIDTVFVLDESVSMNNTINGTKKRDSMVNASKLFVGYLNSTKDRVGIVGYNDSSYYHLIDDQYYLSNNYIKANQTLNDTIGASGGTHINRGLAKMLILYDLVSDYNRDQYALLLTDGRNDADDPTLNQTTIDRAKQAAENDITIYTVGFGNESKINETLLKEVATITEGEYYFANNKSELQAVFSDIATAIASRKKVVHDPASMELGAGGNLFGPQIPGSSDYVANYSDLLNVNDPTTPSNFSFTFSIDDEEPLNLTAYQYECEEWELTGEVQVNETTGHYYYVTRCAEIDTNVTPTEINGSAIHVYTEDNTTDDVKDDLGKTRWFQTNLTEILEPYNESGDLDLKSNQAIVGINYSNGRRLLLLLEIGRSKAANDLTYVVDVTIDDVEIKEKDEQGG